MKASVFILNNGKLITPDGISPDKKQPADLVLGFGDKILLGKEEVFDLVHGYFPDAHIALCSTAGEIFGTKVLDESLTIAAMKFSGTTIRAESINIKDYTDSYSAGKALVSKFEKKDLSYILVLSDGSIVNGSELVRGINEAASRNTIITGGLAGDGAHFESTLVGLNSQPAQGIISGIGFYGSKIGIGHGSSGGWIKFGLEKKVTRANANVVHEIEHIKALELYKKYLGPSDAENLPASALLFPLFVTLPGTSEQVVRTILSIDHTSGSMTFAGDIPEGATVRFMKANFDKITSAAAVAAIDSLENVKQPDFALLISCVGRKLMLQSRVEEEVEAVAEAFQYKTQMAGFYSYGEISPITHGGTCQLHNQTMTITTFSEHE